MQLEALTIPIKTTFSKGPLLGAAAAVTAFVGLAALAIKATFDWAKEMDSLGDVMGGSNEELAAYNYALRVSGTQTETFAKANVILEKSLVKSNGELDTAGKKLKEYGINVKDVNGNLKPMSQLTQEISDKYNSLGTAQERVNFLTEIYGKQGAALIDFFDVLNGEGGVGPLAQKMKNLGLAIDPARYEQFGRNLEKIKIMGLSLAIAFTEKLMPVLEKLIGWISDFATKIPSLLKSAASNPAFQTLITLFELIRVKIELLVREVLAKLQTWFEENGPLIEEFGAVMLSVWQNNIAPAILAAWGIISPILLGLVDLILGIGKTIMQMVTGDWAGAWDTARETISNAMFAIQDAVMGFLNTITTLFGSKLSEVQAIWKSNSEAMQTTVELLKAAIASKVQELVNNFKQKLVDMLTAITDKFASFLQAGNEMAQHIKTGFFKKLDEIISAIGDWIEKLKQAILDAWANFSISIGVNIGGIPKPPGGGGTTTGGGGCFTGDTLIRTPRGLKRIDHFQVGDEILSLDTVSGELVTAKVAKTFKHENIPGYLLLNNRIKVTPEHRIYANSRWTKAGELEPDDALVTARGADKVRSIKWVEELCTVYNLHTDHETHNYFAGGILVHNYKPNEGLLSGGSVPINLYNYGTISIPSDVAVGQSLMRQLRK